jgi:Na+(H+)/acetate symporter ActP
VFAAIITLGGMKVIGYTDVIQVLCLVIGGLVTTWIALDLVARLGGKGHGASAGFANCSTAPATTSTWCSRATIRTTWTCRACPP